MRKHLVLTGAHHAEISPPATARHNCYLEYHKTSFSGLSYAQTIVSWQVYSRYQLRCRIL